MAEAARRSITRRALVAGAAAVPALALAAALSGGTTADAAPAPARPLKPAADPVYRALARHARAYAAYDAQLKAEEQDDLVMERLCRTERKAADALAATVPTTLQGAAVVLAYVRALNDDGYPLLDDYGCYVLIASTETALRRVLEAAV